MMLTVLVALGGGVMVVDGVSNEEERDQRDRLLFFSSPLFSFSCFCYVSLSFLLLFVLLSSFCFYLFFPLCYLFFFPQFLLCSFLYYFINLNLPSLLISPFFSPCSSLFFKTISPFCFFVSFLPCNLKIFSPISCFSKPPPSFPFSLLVFIGKKRERDQLPMSSHDTGVGGG